MKSYFSSPKPAPFKKMRSSGAMARAKAQIERTSENLQRGDYLTPKGRRRAQIRAARQGK